MTATKQPRKLIRLLEQIFASGRGAWTPTELARMVDRSVASVRNAISTLTRDGAIVRLSRGTWISAAEFGVLASKPRATSLPPEPPPCGDVTDRGRRTHLPIADDLDLVDERWARLMGGRRFEDVPHIRALPLWRGRPDSDLVSFTGNAGSMCAEGRGGMVGR